MPTVTLLSCFMLENTPVPSSAKVSGSTTSAAFVPSNAPSPIETSPSLSSIVFNEALLANALLPMLRTEAGSCTVCRRAPSNALSATLTRLVGRPTDTLPAASRTFILVRDPQASNALAPMLVTLSDRVTLDRFTAFSNVLSGMAVMLSGSTARCTDDVANTSVPSDVTPAGTSMSTSDCVL